MNRQERLERTLSMAQNKGLLNNPGENNCFLNSAVQVFWHLDVFRRSFRDIKGHYCMGKSCIFCALENIFKEFQYSSNDALPPDTLRIAMASTFRDQRKFQMGDMDDAAECFENILSRLHFHLVMSEHDDGCNAQHCITHQKFAMHLIEQTICHCGERSEPLPFFQTVHYVSASALCAEGRKNEKLARPEYDYNKHFGTLLRLTGQDTKLCNGQDCGRRIQVQRLLLNCPDIISIGLNWDSESPDAEHIAEVLQCIGTTLKLPHIFHQVSSKTAQQATLHLVGIVTYYGKHYSTFFFHSKLQTWIYFDDAKVREIGPDWSVIRDKCRRCHYQPLLLLYANPNGTKINVATAPKEKIFINPSAIVRKTEISPMNRRISAEVTRHDYERHRKRSRPSSPESGLVESDSESNFSTLKSESKSKTKSSSTIEGSDDTLKARDNIEKTLNEDDNTLKAQDRSRIHRKDMVSLKDDKSPKSRRSKSCDWLEDGSARSSKTRIRGRTGSTGSDVTETLKRKHRDKSGKTKKTGLRRIGSAIFQAMKPAVAISHMKTSKKKSKDRASITSSNGELSPSSETTKQDGLRMNDQAQLDGYLRSPSHDSGIGSATGSVSSSDTNHGGSDDDLVEYSQTLSAMRNGHGINGKVNGRNRKAPPGQHHERCAYLLQEAENLVVQSQKAEKSSEYLNALRYCVDATKHFRRAADVAGPSSNNGRYALMKEEACKKQSESLREKFEAQSHNKMTRNLSPEDELRRTHRRDEMILKQQQQNHAQFGTLQQRNIPTYKQIYPPPPSSSVSSKREDVASVKSDSRIIRPFHPPVATLPAKPKRNSSSHYINRTSPYLNDRDSEGVCTQKIKPDSMCYSPNHYEDVAGRIQGLSLQSNGDVERRRSCNYPDVVRNGDRRSVYDNVIETEPPKSSERRVSVAKIYLQPSGQRLSKSYDPSRYTNGEQDQVRQPKVYYQGASDSREQRSKSYGDSIDASSPYSQVPYNSMPPNYRPAPPSYQSYQQAKGTLHNSVVTTRPWYQEDLYSEQLSSASSPSNLCAISAKMIPDKLVCEQCCQVPISRTQRICGGCVQETFQQHKKLTEATDMLY